MQLFVLPHARSHRGISSVEGTENPEGRRQTDPVPIQHENGEALLLLTLRHLHAPSAQIEAMAIRFQRRLPGGRQPI